MMDLVHPPKENILDRRAQAIWRAGLPFACRAVVSRCVIGEDQLDMVQPKELGTVSTTAFSARKELTSPAVSDERDRNGRRPTNSGISPYLSRRRRG